MTEIYARNFRYIKRESNKSAFVLGENAQLNTSIVKRIYDEGHEIGNHTFKHLT